MNKYQTLLSQIKEIKEKYDKSRNERRFNIFTALHKEHDEVNLHSRFISYLLASNSGHGMGNAFSTLFVREILKLSEEEFDLSNVEVIPNEFNKTEYKEIDILLINKKTKQAIIVENKIYAKDSNHIDKKPGYNGQLERYYNTIKTGIDKDGKSVFDFRCDTVFVFYLTMVKDKQPSPESVGVLSEDMYHVIYYDKEIKSWLETCLSKTPEEKIFEKECIKQYIDLINKMTHNDIPMEERIELKENIAENLDSAKYLIDNFKHVKWHTVSDFWNVLKNKLEEGKYQNVKLYPDNFVEVIGEVTHGNKDINHGITFSIDNEKQVYIASNGLLTWGIVEPKQWTNFKDRTLENICFSDFSTENTFKLIDNKNMENAIQFILEEISVEQQNCFKDLRSES